MVISGTKSSWGPVTSGVSQGSILGPVLLINDLDEEAECTLSKFADNTKLGGVAYMPEDCADIQNDLDRQENWVDRHLMKFNKGKCLPRHQYTLGVGRLVREGRVGFIVDINLTMSQQCTLHGKEDQQHPGLH